MKSFSLIAICIAVIIACVSAVDKQSLLNVHNAERALVGAPALTWSNSLAEYAQQWANNLKNNGCKLQHRSNRAVNGQNVGENLAMWYNGAAKCAGNVDSKNDAYGVCLWNEEKAYYGFGKVCSKTYKGYECSKMSGAATCTKEPCGHYTQVVWSGTNQVGCGVSKCSNGYELLVCNYAAAGNYLGQQPFAESKKNAFKAAADYSKATSGSSSSTPTTPTTPSTPATPATPAATTKTQNGITVESVGSGCRITNTLSKGNAAKQYVKIKCGNSQRGVALFDQKFIKGFNNPAYIPTYYQQTVLENCKTECSICSVSVNSWGPWC